MLNKNKFSCLTISSLFLLSLSSCSKQSNKLNSSGVETTSLYTDSRIISKDAKVNPLNQNLNYENSYDYNFGVSAYPPIGEIVQANQEETFSLDDVNKITENLAKEYNSYLDANSKEYEKYINELTNKFNNLSKEYYDLLNMINGSNNEEITDEQPPKDEEPKDEKPTDTKELLDSIYEKALENASKNLDKFEHIQGQAPKNEESKTNEEINSNHILNLIKNNISLPNYSLKDLNFLTSSYGILQNNIKDFKLLSSDNMNSNLFEMLIIKTSGISEEDLINKIYSRIESIIKSISENNNINVEDNSLLVNLGDYTLFVFSNLSNDILKFLESL